MMLACVCYVSLQKYLLVLIIISFMGWCITCILIYSFFTFLWILLYDVRLTILVFNHCVCWLVVYSFAFQGVHSFVVSSVSEGGCSCCVLRICIVRPFIATCFISLLFCCFDFPLSSISFLFRLKNFVHYLFTQPPKIKVDNHIRLPARIMYKMLTCKFRIGGEGGGTLWLKSVSCVVCPVVLLS
jgi:hypothetical protein